MIAPAGTLTGTTLASNVVTSSLTTVGTIGAGTWQGTAVGATYGGTGINTAASSGLAGVASGTWSVSTLTGDVTTSGFAATLAATANATLASLDKSSGVAVHGVVTNSDAAAGYMGEFISANSPTGGTATPGSDGAGVNVCSITLTPGDWDVQGTLHAALAGTWSGTGIQGGISKSSASEETTTGGYIKYNSTAAIPTTAQYIATGTRRISVSNAGNITVYLVGVLRYTTLGTTTWGTGSIISARRVR